MQLIRYHEHRIAVFFFWRLLSGPVRGRFLLVLGSLTPLLSYPFVFTSRSHLAIALNCFYTEYAEL